MRNIIWCNSLQNLFGLWKIRTITENFLYIVIQEITENIFIMWLIYH